MLKEIIKIDCGWMSGVLTGQPVIINFFVPARYRDLSVQFSSLEILQFQSAMRVSGQVVYYIYLLIIQSKCK